MSGLQSKTVVLGALNDFVDFPCAGYNSVNLSVSSGAFIGSWTCYGCLPDMTPVVSNAYTMVARVRNSLSATSSQFNSSTGFTNSTGLNAIVSTAGIGVLRISVGTYTSGSFTLSMTGVHEDSLIGPMDIAVYAKPTTAINVSTHRLVSAASTNATSVKTTPGALNTGTFMNTSASPRFVKFYNKASAPVVGTDTPVYTVQLPPTTQYDLKGLFVNMPFSVGIAYAITGAAADTDTTAIAAGDVYSQINFT